MLSLENIHWQGGAFKLAIPQWHARGGEFHVLAGCNGEGKSTLLRAMAGELSAQGSVCLHQRPLSAWQAVARARHLAVLPQHSSLSFPFTAGEVVDLGATPLRLDWRARHRAVRDCMTTSNCVHLIDRDYRQLSGGERQRVHLARVLLQLSQADHSPFLLLDEPTSAQDLGQQHALLDQVKSLAIDRGYGVVAVLHDINQSLRYASRVTLISGGRVVDTDRPERVLTEATIQEYWGVAVGEYRSATGQRLLA